MKITTKTSTQLSPVAKASLIPPVDGAINSHHFHLGYTRTITPTAGRVNSHLHAPVMYPSIVNPATAAEKTVAAAARQVSKIRAKMASTASRLCYLEKTEFGEEGLISRLDIDVG